jgi:hypothetical protein
MVAICRATETERPDALFHDPLSGKLAGDHGRKIVASLPRQAKEIRYIAEEAARLERPLSLPFFLRLWIKLRGLFGAQRRREAFLKSTAYVLLEPAEWAHDNARHLTFEFRAARELRRSRL